MSTSTSPSLDDSIGEIGTCLPSTEPTDNGRIQDRFIREICAKKTNHEVLVRQDSLNAVERVLSVGHDSTECFVFFTNPLNCH